MVEPGWMSIRLKPGKKLPTRTIIKNHLKEWNKDKTKYEKVKSRISKDFAEYLDARYGLEEERKGKKVIMSKGDKGYGDEGNLEVF